MYMYRDESPSVLQLQRKIQHLTYTDDFLINQFRQWPKQAAILQQPYPRPTDSTPLQLMLISSAPAPSPSATMHVICYKQYRELAPIFIYYSTSKPLYMHILCLDYLSSVLLVHKDQNQAMASSTNQSTYPRFLTKCK